VGVGKSDTERCVVSVDYTRISTEDSHSGRAASNVAYCFCFTDRLQSSRCWAWACSPRI
jgi:hypothetical protein